MSSTENRYRIAWKIFVYMEKQEIEYICMVLEFGEARNILEIDLVWRERVYHRWHAVFLLRFLLVLESLD